MITRTRSVSASREIHDPFTGRCDEKASPGAERHVAGSAGRMQSGVGTPPPSLLCKARGARGLSSKLCLLSRARRGRDPWTERSALTGAWMQFRESVCACVGHRKEVQSC